MRKREQLLQDILRVDSTNFEPLALAIFRYQATYNPLYQSYIKLLGKTINQVQKVQDIPFLPIQFFKSHFIQSQNWTAQRIFTSSGTSKQKTSRHAVRDLSLYQQISQGIFEAHYGDLTNFCIVALLPSYLERQGSSLVYMVEQFIRQSRHPQSGFFLHNINELLSTLKNCRTQQIPTLLIGVSFALLDLAEQHPMDLSHCIIMETGGMKGRRKEIIRSALHQHLKDAFQVSAIHSEYGMTELLSQAYSKGHGRFLPSPTLRILTREVSDPLQLQAPNRTGGINIIDLANIDTCSFIATDDLGKVYADHSFEIMGRFDASDVRGCNLMI